jgi:4-alpha-glucanotransferase
MLCTTLDDLMVVAERPNIPGAPADHPNWSLALPRPIEALLDAEVVAAVSAELHRAVAAQDPRAEASGRPTSRRPGSSSAGPRGTP